MLAFYKNKKITRITKRLHFNYQAIAEFALLKKYYLKVIHIFFAKFY